MLNKVDDYIFEVPMGHQKGMRVPGRIFISEKLLEQVEPGTIDQVANWVKSSQLRSRDMSNMA